MSEIKIQSEYDDLDKYIYKYNGNIYYCKKNTDITHNPYGPAITWKDGSKFYYIDSKCHRLDGPAMIYSNGEEEYWINDECLTKEEFEIHPERLKYLNKEYLLCLK